MRLGQVRRGATQDLDLLLQQPVAVLSDGEAVARLVASDAEITAGLGESEADLVAAMRGRRDASAS